jgi:hypothetical protein
MLKGTNHSHALSTKYCDFFNEGPSHHSLKAFCATPIKMLRMSSFFTNFYK